MDSNSSESPSGGSKAKSVAEGAADVKEATERLAQELEEFLQKGYFHGNHTNRQGSIFSLRCADGGDTVADLQLIIARELRRVCVRSFLQLCVRPLI